MVMAAPRETGRLASKDHQANAARHSLAYLGQSRVLLVPISKVAGMTTTLKVKPFPGVQLVAREAIEKNSIEQALRACQFKLDRMLHDLRSEFIVRENKLRDEYLAEVAEITAAHE